MARLGFVIGQIREIEEARQKRLEQQPERGAHAMVRRLARIIGVGVETTDMLMHEILSPNLRDRRAVARYAGLTGAPDESGARDGRRAGQASLAANRGPANTGCGGVIRVRLALLDVPEGQRPGPMVRAGRPMPPAPPQTMIARWRANCLVALATGDAGEVTRCRCVQRREQPAGKEIADKRFRRRVSTAAPNDPRRR